MRFKGTYRVAGWQRAAAAGVADGVAYRMWDREDYPTWSLPALEAAKWAAARGADAFERMHFALFEAFFAKGRNIASREEVLAVVREAGLDPGGLPQDFESARFRPEVLREYQEAQDRYGITAIPTVVFEDELKVVGAVPRAEYEQILTAKFGLQPIPDPR